MSSNAAAYADDSVVTYVDEVEMSETRIPDISQPLRARSRPASVSEVDDLEPPTKRGTEFDEDDDRGIDDGLFAPNPFTPRPSNGLGPQSPFDVNVYQQKKTLAQGMMDLALISANANQLRYVLASKSHPFYYASLAMISMSLILQIAVGIGLIWNSRYDVKEDDQVSKANKANNWTVIGVFLVTILNVFISSFGVIDGPDVITIPLTSEFDNVSGVEPLKSISNLNTSLQ